MQTMPWCLLWCGAAEFAFGRSMEPGFRFCVSAFAGTWLSFRVGVFTFNLVKTFYKFSDFNAINEDHDVINHVTVQQE